MLFSYVNVFIDHYVVLRSRSRTPEELELQMKPKGRNENGSARAIVAWMVDILRIQRSKYASPDMRRVVGFQDVLTGVTQFSVSQQESFAGIM